MPPSCRVISSHDGVFAGAGDSTRSQRPEVRHRRQQANAMPHCRCVGDARGRRKRASSAQARGRAKPARASSVRRATMYAVLELSSIMLAGAEA